MTRTPSPRLEATHFASLWLCVLGGGLAVAALAAGGDRIQLVPKLQNGESVQYETRARIDRHVATKSNVRSVVGPRQGRRDLASALRLDVQEFRVAENRPMLSGETRVVPLDAPDPDTAPVKPAKVVFTI